MKKQDIKYIKDKHKGFTRLKRSCFTIGFFGNKGEGKTFVMALLGLIFKQQGFIIFSNINLSYNHVRINNIKDFNKIYDYDINTNKLFIGDDFERNFNSRLFRSDLNVALNEILIDWGKINCSCLYSSKRNQIIDIGLRDTTDQFWYISKKLMYHSDYFNINDYLDFYQIIIQRFDCNLNPLSTFSLSNLPLYKNLYETQEIVNKFSQSGHSLRKNEKHFLTKKGFFK